MSKSKPISTKIAKLEAEAERLKTYEKCLDLLLKAEYGIDRKTVDKLIATQFEERSGLSKEAGEV